MTGKITIQVSGVSVGHYPYAHLGERRKLESRALLTAGTKPVTITIVPFVTPEIEELHFRKALVAYLQSSSSPSSPGASTTDTKNR